MHQISQQLTFLPSAESTLWTRSAYLEENLLNSNADVNSMACPQVANPSHLHRKINSHYAKGTAVWLVHELATQRMLTAPRRCPGAMLRVRLESLAGNTQSQPHRTRFLTDLRARLIDKWLHGNVSFKATSLYLSLRCALGPSCRQHES